MNIVATQEDIDIFSSDPTGVKEIPEDPYYQDGVDVGYTAPAKWWNWLWNKITSILMAHKADWLNMTSEMTNTLSTASITPDSGDSHQLSKATNQIAYDTCGAYDNAEEDGHKVNQPYVIGHTLYIPDTELL